MLFAPTALLLFSAPLCSSFVAPTISAGARAAAFSARRHEAATSMAARVPVGESKAAESLRDGMPYHRIGESDLVVSKVCLGTMTWGEQTSEQDAMDQLNAAVDDYGVNFLDTSELYPAPVDEETSGASEKIVGKWLKGRARDDLVISSKIAAFGPNLDWLRQGADGTVASKEQIVEAVDATLARLGCDHIDLLQLEWPDRYLPAEGPNGYDDMEGRVGVPIAEQLSAFDGLIKAGKVRHIGLSNETPYGVAKFLEVSKSENLPRIISVQNSYNLLERNDYESTLAELCHHEGIDLLAHTPLAGGALTGKYADGSAGDDARMLKYQGYTARYLLPFVNEAIEEYRRIAKFYGVSLTQMSLAWCYTRPFVASTLVGASNMAQLHENLKALNCPLTEAMALEIYDVFLKYRDPTKITAEIGARQGIPVESAMD